MWRTGVVLVAAQLERGLPCHFSNHPAEIAGGSPALSTLLLGCVSPLTYFPPVLIDGLDGSQIALCEADIVGAANPSLHVLLLVSAERFQWRLGRYRLSLFSIGGLRGYRQRDAREVAEGTVISQMPLLVDAMMHSTSRAARLLLTALAGDDEAPLSFSRFQASGESLPAELAPRFATLSWEERGPLWPDLEALGQRLANEQMRPEILSPAFDVRIVGAESDGT
jgi:hypothetical protein